MVVSRHIEYERIAEAILGLKRRALDVEVPVFGRQFRVVSGDD